MMKKDLKEKIYCVGMINDIKNGEQKIRIENGYKAECFEYMVFVNNSQMGKCKSIFYMIRNSFAHGSFNIKKNNNENYYYLESSKSNSIKAIMCLKEKTLIKWINDVKTKDFIKKKK